MDDKEKGEVIE